MKFLPGIGVSKLSGTIGGVTAQSWRGLGIFRRKPIPTKNLTARQMVINSIMTVLSVAWRDELNQGQRTAWNQHAKNYPWVDVFGNERKMTGENLYIKQNMVLLDNFLERQDLPVPGTTPPELIDLSIEVEEETLSINAPQMAEAIVNAQTPFLDIWVAGGFTSVEVLPAEPHVNVTIFSQCLPAGRKNQKSDMRHVAYAMDKAVTEPADPGHIILIPPAFITANCVMIIRRYNKYGNFTAPLMFEGIRTGA